MIKVTSAAAKKRVKDYVIAFRNKQDELETDDTLIYSTVPVGLAVKHNVLLTEFMLHPLLIKRRKFHEQIIFVSDKNGLIDIITKVLEYELSDAEEPSLSNDSLKKLAKAHTRLTKKKNTSNAE